MSQSLAPWYSARNSRVRATRPLASQPASLPAERDGHAVHVDRSCLDLGHQLASFRVRRPRSSPRSWRTSLRTHSATSRPLVSIWKRARA